MFTIPVFIIVFGGIGLFMVDIIHIIILGIIVLLDFMVDMAIHIIILGIAHMDITDILIGIIHIDIMVMVMVMVMVMEIIITTITTEEE